MRRQVKSITIVLQVRGAGNERVAIYAFNALLADYPSDRLHTGREIAIDDLAAFPTRNTIGTSSLVPPVLNLRSMR